MASLSLTNISCTFRARKGDVHAVADLSLDVNHGELIVLVGPSGCGKTTTLRLVAGFERLSAGAIRIGDRNMNEVAPRNRDVAMVFQHYALYPHMSVYKNMAFGLTVRGNSKIEVGCHVSRVAERLGIAALLDRRPSQLSGGERQRVALGRAIVRKPQLFLLDEPLSNLDESLRAGMRAEIKTLQRELGTTMVYVTHDQAEAMTLGDRIAVLRHGRLQQLGLPMEIYDRPVNRFVAGFFGSPPMNLIEGELRAEYGNVVFQSSGLRIMGVRSGSGETAVGSQSVVLGIRPHDIMVRSADATGSNAAGDWQSGLVRLVEPLGDCHVLRIVVGGGMELTAKAVANHNWAAGERVEVALPPERLHLFETNVDGRRISRE